METFYRILSALQWTTLGMLLGLMIEHNWQLLHRTVCQITHTRVGIKVANFLNKFL